MEIISQPKSKYSTGQGHYKEEFAFIQMSDDFKNVRYGTQEQIKAQQKENLKKMEEMLKVADDEANKALDDEGDDLEEGKTSAETGNDEESKKKKKKRNKKGKEKEIEAEQILNEVQEELGDLISSMNIGGSSKN